ncbi:longitudinals lacking isoform X1 [Rhynchophorus ferrugineus]|uniref:longitudinals lacking isoform X1 n=1 Tax=Rhynchophorus ferrugineus TaxID=354439 RepID=UPI003FCE6124
MDDDQQFCLRWNNHQSTLVAVFDTLLENGTLVDCTLAAEGKFLNAHKVVLSACSPYFEALLSRHYDKHPILILKDVKFQELKAMMDYMYRGEVNISQDQLGALLKAAESLQIKGLSDNKKEEPAKRPAPAPAPPKSPQPQAQLPKVQGLTIEQRSRDDREGSMSPGLRKKKRMRRKSEDMDNHDASNSSDAHSMSSQNIPSATSQISTANKMNSSDLPDTIETKQEIMTRHKEEAGSQQQVPMIKEKLETHTELMLEPKSEYVEEMNEDSIEDLTLDDDDISNMEQVDEGAGPSHGGEGSSQQGFGHWQMGNQSQDEVFLAAQEAVGAHRDSQGGKTKTFQVRSQKDFERRSTLSSGYFTCHQTETERKSSYSSKIPDAKSTKVSDFGSVPSHKYEDRPYSGSRDCNQKKAGLLTDSLSCIFTRRPKRNNQHRAPQKRVFFEEVRAALASPAIDTNDCPLPPTISKEENPNWTPVDICPEPPLISNKSVGQDVSVKESNVSPYVPKNMFELDEYSKYKTQQLGKESKYKQMTGEASGRYHHQDDDVLDDTREDYDEELSKYDIASYAITSTKDVGNHYQYDYKQSYYDATSYGNNKYTDSELENICPEAPNISGNSQLEEEEDEETAPEPPKISSTQLYPGGASNVQDAQRKCHKCSFQTGNPKRLKDHLKFVHGETTDMDVDGQPKKTNELFSRREPKPTDTSGELFSRRGYTNKPDFSRRENVPPPEDGGKKFPGTFKRRNTSVNIISSNVLVPAHKEPDNGQKTIDSQYENQDPPSGKRQDSGVLAAMEYFENSKDQVKKPRPYKRNADELLDDKWF